MRMTEVEVVEQTAELTLRRLRLWVRRGWVSPTLTNREPVFDSLDIARIRLVCQLKDDLNINDDAIPVVLSLIDQLHGIRRELRMLTAAVDTQPETVRERIRRALSDRSDRC